MSQIADTSSVRAPQKSAFSLRGDLVSGFLVFLIALPLCLGIANASKFPAICGIWTAVAGGILCFFLSNSQLTIKGPAAGLIVIVEGCVLAFAHDFAGLESSGIPTEAQKFVGFRLALGVGVAAGLLQVLLGVIRAGKLGDLIPLTPIHGMLASIGITIFAKQLFVMAGMPSPSGEPIKAFEDMPEILHGHVFNVLLVGVVSLALLVFLNFVPNKNFRIVPPAVVVLLVGIVLGMLLQLDKKFLVPVPNVLSNLGFADEPGTSYPFALPDFRGLLTGTGIRFLILFTVIGSLESALSAKAIDLKDPLRRKTNLDRDLIAVGAANAAVACVGGLPMISEIVRSSANINNGGRTKYANLFHGLFLLTFVLLAPALINLIPLSCLGAMLVFTGFRLASPGEFVKMGRIGWDQLLVFVTTIVVVLCTDLLVGVLAGIALKILIQLCLGVRPADYLRLQLDTLNTQDGTVLRVRNACVFSTWLALRRQILAASETGPVHLDLGMARYVDHSTMEKLHELEHELEEMNRHLDLSGLENHQSLSSHELAARRRVA